MLLINWPPEWLFPVFPGSSPLSCKKQMYHKSWKGNNNNKTQIFCCQSCGYTIWKMTRLRPGETEPTCVFCMPGWGWSWLSIQADKWTARWRKLQEGGSRPGWHLGCSSEGHNWPQGPRPWELSAWVPLLWAAYTEKITRSQTEHKRINSWFIDTGVLKKTDSNMCLYLSSYLRW